MKFQAFKSSYFLGKNHFEDDGSQNYLVIQLVYRYFKNIANSDHISAGKFKGLPDEITRPPTASKNSLCYSVLPY